MLHHYILLKYQPGTSAEHINTFCEKMLALPDVIDTIKSLSIGKDELHEGRSWDLLLIMQFESVDALRHYQKHPAHVAVMQFNDAYVADIGAIDFHA